MSAPASEGISRLPAELLVSAFQHGSIDQRQRLASCALVSKAWHAAAVAASADIRLWRATEEQGRSLAAWLCQHPGSVRQLSLHQKKPLYSRSGDEPEAPQLYLPFSQLHQLCSLSLGFMHLVAQQQQPSAPASLAPLTALTCLSLSDCSADLSTLSALTGLQSLHLDARACDRLHHAVAADTSSAAAAAIGGVLSTLQGLTSLSLSTPYCCSTAMQHVSRLLQLQQLCMGGEVSADSLAEPLPNTLTKLAITDGGALVISPSTTPGLCALTGLQELSIYSAKAVHPAVLAGLDGLRNLAIQYGPLEVSEGEIGLSVLSGFTQLVSLDFSTTLWPGPALPTADDCTVLTSSRQLTCLKLGGCWLPEGGASKVLPAEGQVPQLPSITTLAAAPEMLASADDVMRLTSCCPSISDLTVASVPREMDVDFTPRTITLSGLEGLTALTRLHMDGVNFAGSSREALRSLGRAPALQVLCMRFMEEGISLADLMVLVACTKLTDLYFDTTYDNCGPSECDIKVEVCSEPLECRPANVWRQLPSCLALTASTLYKEGHLGGFALLQMVEDLAEALLELTNPLSNQHSLPGAQDSWLEALRALLGLHVDVSQGLRHELVLDILQLQHGAEDGAQQEQAD